MLMCGDLNTLPNQSALKLLTTCLELQDSFHHENCSPISCLTCEKFYTCDRKDNVFKERGSVPKRIDYIMYSDLGSAWSFTKKEFCITMDGMVPGKMYNFSDHVGLRVVLQIENRDDAPGIKEMSFTSGKCSALIVVLRCRV